MNRSDYRPHQPRFGEPHTYDLVQAQRQISKAFERLDSGRYQQISDNKGTIRNIALAAGFEQRVEHGLGRTINGYRVVWQNAPAIIYVVHSSTADLSRYLPLATTMDVTIRLEVF